MTKAKTEYIVSRHYPDDITITIRLGDVRDLVDAEYDRAGSAFHLRPMWYTGSPFGAEIVKLLLQVRGEK